MSRAQIDDEQLESDTARASDIEQQDQQDSYLYGVTSQTPWWIVSILLHALIIVMAGLISMAIEMPKGDDPVVMVTTIEDRKEVKLVHDAPPPNTSVQGPAIKIDDEGQTEILVLRDLAAELSDRFRTDNNALEDGCNGVPDAKVFDPVGKIDEPGGGGKDGLTPLSDSMVGVGGAASSGRGGGDGSGDGEGFGPGNGKGTGTFGDRTPGKRATRAKTKGGGPITENAVNQALRWLAYHQEPDGHWDAKKYNGLKVDTAMTSLATLAFLGAGHSEKVGEYKDHVKRAVAWLKSKQAANGLVFDTTDEGGHRGVGYPHAMAAMALAEAYGMGSNPDTKIAAQKAIDYATELHQQGEGSEKLAFRYAAKSAGDISVTGWYVMAMKAAKVCGLAVNHASFEGALKFLEKVEVKNAGGDSAYGAASRFAYMPGTDTNHRRGAIGNLCRQFMGWKKEELQSSVELFIKDGGVPAWGANGESVDLYYWYYGSYCCFQQGGDVWKQWNVGMVKTLVENQSRNGDDAGSWNPVGAFSQEWGRVGQTALGALCLEVYYRYPIQGLDKH